MAGLVFDHVARRRLDAGLEHARFNLVPARSGPEYFAGLEWRVPTLGEDNYTHGWAAGAFLAPGRDSVSVLPRVAREFHLPLGCTDDRGVKLNEYTTTLVAQA